MAEYPIRVPRDPSRAKRGEARRRRLNNLAARLEEHINAQLAPEPAGTRTFMYAYLAADLGVFEDDVRDAMMRTPGAGHNGLMVVKR